MPTARMKPRIFINMHYMELGGAERALLGLLDAIDTERVDVDLFINQHTGPFMRMIPEKINLLPEIPAYSAIERPMGEILREGHFVMAWRRLQAKRKYRRYLRSLPAGQAAADGSASHYWMNEAIKSLPSLEYLGEYDLAISFLDPPHIVQRKVRAKRRIEWIHTDFNAVHIDIPSTLPHWAGNDYIASISPDVTRSFLKLYPSLAPKVVGIENILPTAQVRCDAEAFDAGVEMNRGSVKLLSIGRYCTAKNYDNVPDICRRLTLKGVDAVWYIIGFGDDTLIRRRIAEAGMEERVVLLGRKDNPYPYIKACDIYVQPSRFEGKSVTVREAQVLCRPVAITNYPTAPSQVADGRDGIIMPLDNEGCAEALADFVRRPALRQEISAYLATHDYSNESEVEKIYKLLNA